jgi:hypothetical protein
MHLRGKISHGDGRVVFGVLLEYRLLRKLRMYIVAIAWIYVVLMMSLTEHSLIAGIMTFLLYCVLPLTIILYLMGTPRRRQRQHATRQRSATDNSPEQDPAAPPLQGAAPNAGAEETPKT